MNVRTTKYVLLSNYSVFGVCSIFDGWIWCFRGGGGGGAADALNYIMRARTTLVRLSGGRINSAAALRQKWSKTTDTPHNLHKFALISYFQFGWIRYDLVQLLISSANSLLDESFYFSSYFLQWLSICLQFTIFVLLKLLCFFLLCFHLIDWALQI